MEDLAIQPRNYGETAYHAFATSLRWSLEGKVLVPFGQLSPEWQRAFDEAAKHVIHQYQRI